MNTVTTGILWMPPCIPAGELLREYTPPEHPVQSLAAKREREEEEEQAI